MANGSSGAPLLASSPEEAAPTKQPSIDDVIEMCIGTTGTLQLLKTFLVAFAWAFDAQQVFISAFTDAEPRWSCLTASTGSNSSCSPTAASPCALPPGTWAWDRPAEASVVSEWALSCAGGGAGPALVSLPASSFFAGCLAGGFLLTTLADSLLGRKKMLLVSLVSTSVAGVLTIFAPNIWAYAALRLVSGFFRSMVGTCTLVLSTELVGKRWRDTVSVASFFFFAVGFLSLPALAYAFRDASWRNMYFWTSVPCLCYSFLVYLLVQESPRWLLVRGRKLDAMEALQQIISLNGSRTSATARSLFSVLDACTMHEDNAAFDASGGAGGVFATLQAMWERRWALRRLAAITSASFGVGMVYFGLPLNVGSLGSNLYLSVAFNALAELASAVLTWLLIARADRRGSVIALTAVAGACSLACVAIPRGAAAAARMAAELLSFTAACTAFDVILIYSTEMFPTSVRNSAVGLVRQAMVLGGMAAPMLIALGRSRNSFWSFGVFGIAIGCSGLFVACLPETRGKRTSDTMEEEEERNQDTVASCTTTSAPAGRCTDSNSYLV